MKRLLAVLLLTVSCLSWVRAGDTPAPPRDALFTIYCQSFTGPDRVIESKMMRESLMRATGMKEFYVITGASDVALYYGYYRTIFENTDSDSDRHEARRAHEDLKKLKSIRDADDHRPLAMAMLVPIAQVGHEGPPEWDLLNTPKDACWTILIAVYRDNPERMKAAVEAVKRLRADGVDAYYMHSDTCSIVCIGTWPKNAVIPREVQDVKPQSPDEAIVVMPVPLSETPIANLDPATTVLNSEGKRVRFVAPEKLDIRDANLRKTLDKYPDFMINGQLLGSTVQDPKTKEKRFVGDRSLVYQIRRPDAGILDGSRPAGPPPKQALQQIDPSLPAQPARGGKRLKSLDD